MAASGGGSVTRLLSQAPHTAPSAPRIRIARCCRTSVSSFYVPVGQDCPPNRVPQPSPHLRRCAPATAASPADGRPNPSTQWLRANAPAAWRRRGYARQLQSERGLSAQMRRSPSTAKEPSRGESLLASFSALTLWRSLGPTHGPGISASWRSRCSGWALGGAMSPVH